MRNIFKNLFNRSAVKTQESEIINKSTQDLPEIPKELFVETANPIPSGLNQEKADPLKSLLNRNHHAAGYVDGYDFHDASRKENYQDVLIQEVRDIFKNEIWRIDQELVRLNGLLRNKGDLDNSIIGVILEQIDAAELKRKHFIDEFEASEFSRGKIRLALLQYERGFSEGYKNYLESTRFTSIIQPD